MKFFLRFTATPDLDLKRGTSYHETPWDKGERTKKEVAEACGCATDAIVLLPTAHGTMRYAMALGGLCGFALEADTLEEAIEEVEENYSGDSSVGFSIDQSPWAIFTGGSVENTLPDGDVFWPRAVVHQAHVAA